MHKFMCNLHVAVGRSESYLRHLPEHLREMVIRSQADPRRTPVVPWRSPRILEEWNR
jgi:hypothetical protein